MKNLEEIKLFGDYLRKLRNNKNLSQQELADISNLSKITIQRIENSKFRVTLDTLISISNALEISLSELVNYKN